MKVFKININHKRRKAASLRKEKLRFKDGLGRYRADNAPT